MLKIALTPVMSKTYYPFAFRQESRAAPASAANTDGTPTAANQPRIGSPWQAELDQTDQGLATRLIEHAALL
jgi:hypothetical protein